MTKQSLVNKQSDCMMATGSIADIEPSAPKEEPKPNSDNVIHSDESTEEDEEDEGSFLENVYLQKTPYVIQNSFVEQIDDDQ